MRPSFYRSSCGSPRPWPVSPSGLHESGCWQGPPLQNNSSDEQLLPAATLLRPVREEHNARMVDHRGAFAPKLEKSSNPRKCRVVISRAVGVAIGTGYDT